MSKFIEKIKSNKKLQTAIVIVLVIVLFAIFASTLLPKNNTKNDSISIDNYAAELEEKLSKTLSAIDGAGSVNVMISLEGGPEIEIAYTTEERKNSSSGTGSGSESITIIKTPILITNNGKTEPIILSKKNPKIKGVIVVAGGADNVRVKMEILRAAQAVLKIEASTIEIFAGKK